MSELEIYKGMVKKMKDDEIKEILDRLECDKDNVYYVGYTDGVNIDNTLMPKDIKLLLDYITNLQQENERLKELKENASNVCMAEHRYAVDKAEEARDYKSRCEKANNFIEENWISYKDSKDFKEFDEVLEVFIKEINELYNILNGRSDE